MMEYKGYMAKVAFDDQTEVFHGEIINTRDVITFQGQSVRELTQAFRNSIEDYLQFCRELGVAPDKPFSGQFVTRISPKLHRQINLAATLCNKSLNAWVTEQLQKAMQGATQPEGKKVSRKSKARKHPLPGRCKSAFLLNDPGLAKGVGIKPTLLFRFWEG